MAHEPARITQPDGQRHDAIFQAVRVPPFVRRHAFRGRVPAQTQALSTKAGASTGLWFKSTRTTQGQNLALNNVQNLLSYYKDKGEKVQIEVVAFGPGLHMLRQDTSPVKDRVAAIAAANPEVQFSACSNTLANMTKQEGGHSRRW